MEANLRFWNKVNKDTDSGCWEWQGCCAMGYGSFFLNGRYMKAHRYAYETLIGEVPTGLEIDHLCRNRRCVNPDHMEPVTRGENIRRGLLPDIGRQHQEAKDTVRQIAEDVFPPALVERLREMGCMDEVRSLAEISFKAGQKSQPRTPRADLENELADKEYAKLYRKVRIKTQREINLCLEAHKAGIREVVGGIKHFNHNYSDTEWGDKQFRKSVLSQLKKWGL